MNNKLQRLVNWIKDLPERYEQLKFTLYARYYYVRYVQNRHYNPCRSYYSPEPKYDSLRLAAEVIRISHIDGCNLRFKSLVVKAYKPGDDLAKLGKDND